MTSYTNLRLEVVDHGRDIRVHGLDGATHLRVGAGNGRAPLGHLLAETDRLRITNWHFKHGRDFWPDVPPSETVAIGNIEGLIPASRLRRSPQRRIRKMR